MHRLEFSKRTPLRIWAKQGDSGRELEFQCINDSLAMDLTGCSVTMNMSKPVKVFAEATITDAVTGKIKVNLTANMLSQRGIHPADISIFKANGKLLSSTTFDLDIDASQRDDTAIKAKDEMSAIEIAKQNIEKLEQDYAPELNAVKTSLAQTATKIPNMANATDTLKILNPYGDFQNIHPKVLYFENGWNGYKWWMAYTPYPRGEIKKENPCIAVSNDGINWGLPTGLSNGLMEDWLGVENAYNNDTHLVYRSDLNRLEIWWRYADSNTSSRIANLRRRTSTNGTTWTPTETMFTGVLETNDHISPAIIFEDNKYKMLSVQRVSNWRVFYSESTDGMNWGTRTQINVDLSSGLTLWHLDFIKTSLGYEMIVQAFESGKTTNTASLYYSKSSDLINFSKPILILSPTSLDTFDNQGIYRSSIVKIANKYYLFYSSVKTNTERSLALSVGENIEALKGLEYNQTQIVQSPDITNTVEVRQKTNTDKFGALKVGNIVFANGLIHGVPQQEGSMRYNADRKMHQVYVSDRWMPVGSQALVFAEGNASQNMVSGSFVNLNYGRVVFTDGNYSSGVYTVPSTATYKITLGVKLLTMADGDEVEINIKNTANSSDLRFVIKEKVKVASDNSVQFTGSTFISLDAGNTIAVGVKYTGASAAKTSQYPAQNYMLIEKIQ